MKISYNWLKDYLKCTLTEQQLALLLTDIGLEVEGIEQFESVKGGLQGFVTGEVLTCEKHPNAERLSKTTVDAGSGKILNIVCGAPNVAQGQKVIVALEGAIVYKGEESFKISRSKIRGEVSEGMICAEDELGIGESHEGILILPEDVKIGMPAADYFKITKDTIFEIGITPNHADALSHIGVARDLAAAVKVRGLGDVEIIKPDLTNFTVDNHDIPISIKIEDTDGCIRYAGISVSGVKVQSSPEWLQTRLKAIGVRPINNIVDISNYILFEYGQPLHTFDASTIAGNSVIVKKAAAGSTFVTLDKVKRKLSENDLLICNAEEGMCMAGVFGGVKSGVTNNTTSVFIESAVFNPVTIRKTSKLYGLKTDASFRFERGIDPDITVDALKKAAVMIRDIAGGYIASEITDIYPNPVKYSELLLKYAAVDKLIGVKLPVNEIKNILLSLQIIIIEEQEDALLIAIPPFKVDVKTTADVVEEILRIYGYNKIESGNQMRSSISFSKNPDQEKLYNRAADYLAANNFNEILTNSLSSSEYYSGSKWFPAQECVTILNPLSKELDVMRQTLLFGGLESLSHNINRRQLNLKFFEFGTVYKEVNKSIDVKVTERFHERKLLSLFVTGQEFNEHWKKPGNEVDFHFLNAVVQNLMKTLGIDTKLLIEDALPVYYAAGRAFKFNNKAVYSIGNLNTELTKKFDISQKVITAQLEWDYLVALTQKNKVSYREVPRFPEVRRDLALVLETNTSYSEIEKVAFKINKHLLKRINLFDVYEGDKIEAGKKSYAVSFILQDENKTLTDKEIDSFMQKLAYQLEQELGARVRK